MNENPNYNECVVFIDKKHFHTSTRATAYNAMASAIHLFDAYAALFADKNLKSIARMEARNNDIILPYEENYNISVYFDV